VERNLVDEINVKEEKARILFHLTTPFCPLPFALQIGRDIKKKKKKIKN